jgi:two-component system, chemotaxis family, protein-glutamate methylesterase/glutaminase
MERDLVVIGGSAGSVGALAKLLGALPLGLPASVAIVVHRPERGSGGLEAVLRRASRLAVVDAEDGAPLTEGQALLAPARLHLLVREGHVVLAPSAKINRVRPAVDPLFRSAARWYGPRVIGVVLSGSLDDGAAGLAAIQARGGACLVQDPDEAMFPSMPLAAAAAAPEAKVLPVAELAIAIVDLAGQPISTEPDPPSPDLVAETDLAEHGRRLAGTQPGAPIPIGCPDCRGGMSRVDVAGQPHFVCHVGHSFGAETLVAAQSDIAENSLQTAVSVLEEREATHRMLAEQTTGSTREEHLRAAEQAARAAASIRATIRSAMA